MTKRRKKSGAVAVSKNSKWTDVAIQGGEIMAGIAAGSAIANTVGSKGADGVDLLGLSGDTSGYVSPLVTAAAGAAAIVFGKNDLIRNVGMGCVIAGGVKMLNKFMGKSVISLSGTDENEKVILPGIGDVDSLSVEAPNFVPTENAWQTSYNEPQLIANPEVSGIGEILTEPVGSVLL